MQYLYPVVAVRAESCGPVFLAGIGCSYEIHGASLGAMGRKVTNLQPFRQGLSSGCNQHELLGLFHHQWSVKPDFYVEDKNLDRAQVVLS